MKIPVTQQEAAIDTLVLNAWLQLDVISQRQNSMRRKTMRKQHKPMPANNFHRSHMWSILHIAGDLMKQHMDEPGFDPAATLEEWRKSPPDSLKPFEEWMIVREVLIAAAHNPDQRPDLAHYYQGTHKRGSEGGRTP